MGNIFGDPFGADVRRHGDRVRAARKRREQHEKEYKDEEDSVKKLLKDE